VTEDPSSGVVLRSLADYRSYSLRAFCQGCRHNELLDIEKIGSALGWGFALVELKKRLRCSKCRRRPCDVFISHSGAPVRESL